MIIFFKQLRKIYFSKMHGLSNDFMVIDCTKQNFIPTILMIKKLSDRHTGIGFDQLLMVEKLDNSIFDFNYRIFNSNGIEVEQCGNGARCLSLFVLLKKLTNKKKIFVQTLNKNLIINFIDHNNIQVNMSTPDFKLHESNILEKKDKKNFLTKNSSDNLIYNTVSMGNPHCIIQVQSIKNAPVNVIGQKMQKNKNFPKGVNVGFMEVLNQHHIKLRVYERHVGETKSCGSGACAAVAIGVAQKLLSHKVKVDLLGGSLFITWKGFGHDLYMTGSAKHVYDGHIYIK